MKQSKKYSKSIFIFTRDLRIKDNTALNEALRGSEVVIPLFIFDPRQVGDDNPYKSTNAIQFMIESLQELETALKEHNGMLSLFYGKSDEVLESIFKDHPIDAVFINEDYTPFSQKRDENIKKLCKKENIDFHIYRDYLLFSPDEIATKTGKPYSVFTPFFKATHPLSVDTPKIVAAKNFYPHQLTGAHNPKELYKKVLPTLNDKINVHGGRMRAQKILDSIATFKSYKQTRDIPSIETSNLAAYIKFGCVSIREVYHAIANTLGKNHDLIRQLYWREFFTHVAFHYPYVFGNAFQEKYQNLDWKNSKADFTKWTEGNTGFPIVDAGMRQLNTTGFMHNRTRMIVASFLTKDLHIDWRWGEKYFAQKLVDYDPCVNNGSWQWAASTGCDAQPYFRIFNPWLQQKKFDPECIYIKTWIPELAKIDNKIIHNWFKENTLKIADYPRPMVDHKIESEISKKIYKTG